MLTIVIKLLIRAKNHILHSKAEKPYHLYPRELRSPMSNQVQIKVQMITIVK
jgi:hypothetical protein